MPEPFNFNEWHHSVEQRDIALRDHPTVGRPDTQQHQRHFELDRTRAQDDGQGGRTIEASLSSEQPVLRYNAYEVLRHDPESVDLSRASDGLPLLFCHDQSQPIGICENVRLHDGKLRARLRFGESGKAQEVWRDIRSGVLKNMSIGYQILKSEYDEHSRDFPVQTATRWELLESSIVAVPADPTVGVARSLKGVSPETLPPSEADVRQHLFEGSLQRIYQSYVAPDESNPDYQERVDQAREFWGGLIKRRDHDAALLDANQFLNTRYRSMPTPVVPSDPGLVSRRDPFKEQLSNFSYRSAILVAAGDRTVDAGPILEVSQELGRMHGKKPQSGFFAPMNMGLRDVTAGGSGANLIGVDHLGDQFIEPLRPRSIVMSLPVQNLPGLVGSVSIPRQTASATAAWLNLDGSTSITESTPTFDSITMTPHSCAGFVEFSHKMLTQSSPGIENLIRGDLGQVLGTAIDIACINGDGTGSTPLGILNVSGIGSVVHGGSPTWGDVVDLEGEVLADSADSSGMVYVTTPGLAKILKQTEKASGTAAFVLESVVAEHSSMNGYKTLISSSVPAGVILFGDFSQLIVGSWGLLELSADGGGARFATGNIAVRCIADVDFGIRHPEAFAAGTTA